MPSIFTLKDSLGQQFYHFIFQHYSFWHCFSIFLLSTKVEITSKLNSFTWATHLKKVTLPNHRGLRELKKVSRIVTNSKPFEGLVEIYETFKKVSHDVDNHFKSVLGYYETIFRVSNSLQKKIRYGTFFFSADHDRHSDMLTFGSYHESIVFYKLIQRGF